jgi:hypothetical protein
MARAASARVCSRSRFQIFVSTSIFTRSRVQTRTGPAPVQQPGVTTRLMGPRLSMSVPIKPYPGWDIPSGRRAGGAAVYSTDSADARRTLRRQRYPAAVRTEWARRAGRRVPGSIVSQRHRSLQPQHDGSGAREAPAFRPLRTELSPRPPSSVPRPCIRGESTAKIGPLVWFKRPLRLAAVRAGS